jgi:ribosome biogenesis protein NSA1
MVMDFGELPIWSVAQDPAGHVVYAGNGGGDLASFDLRTGESGGERSGVCIALEGY